MNYTKGEWTPSDKQGLFHDSECKTWLAWVRSIERNHSHNADYPIARVTGDTQEESLANAHLISAAPEMYEALTLSNKFMKALHKQQADLFNDARVVMLETTIEQALAKANGE